MKMKRLLASVLALLLVVSILPMTALAEDNEEDGKAISSEIGTNSGYNVTVEKGGSVQTNKGNILSNAGTVGSYTDDDKPDETTGNKSTILGNAGTVVVNNGIISYNGVGYSADGGVSNVNTDATVELNNNQIVYNVGKVTTNAERGYIGTNYGTVTTNNGTVDKNSTTTDTQGNEFKGVIDTNNGTVISNNEDGKVETNAAGGTIESNEGIVGTNNGKVEDNSGEVRINFDTVETNKSGGVVGKDVEYDPATGDYCYDLSGGNFGTITTNEGIVSQNGGLLFQSDGNGGYTEDEYTGTITTNAKGGTVLTNWEGSTIQENYGTVVVNDGTVTNKDGGEVKYNNGTIINEEGGKLYEYIIDDYRTDEAPEISKTITEAGTYHRISVDKGYLHEDGDNYTWTYASALLQKRNGDKIDLTKLFKQDGYKVSSYYEQVGKDYVEGTGTTYTASDKPSYLYLIWEKIQAVCSSGSAKPVKAAAIPTSVAAEDVKVGTVVRAKGQLFKVIEMDDGSITVVTMGKLSKKDLENLMAYLAKFLTPEQIELLLGNPEQISEELAAKLFGGNTNHIVFKAAKNLFV